MAPEGEQVAPFSLLPKNFWSSLFRGQAAGQPRPNLNRLGSLRQRPQSHYLGRVPLENSKSTQVKVSRDKTATSTWGTC